MDLILNTPITIQEVERGIRKLKSGKAPGKDGLPAEFLESTLKSQYQLTRKVFVYKIQVNPIHTILKYGEYYDFMDR